MINKNYGEKCDVWSIAIVLYFILCGDLPFYGNDDAKVKFTILNGRIFFRQSIWSQRSNKSKDFIKLLLSPNPADRPSCM
jgi:serine/threonine protein kinase